MAHLKLGSLVAFSFFVLFGALLLAACATPPPQTILHTQMVERTVLVPVTVEVTRLIPTIITATPAPPTATPTPAVLRLCFAPEARSSARTQARQDVVALLRLSTGLNVQAIVPPDEDAAIAALCDGNADAAWLSTPAYLLAHETCKAEARLSVVRAGAATLQSAILVQSAAARLARGLSPIRSLQDLAGRSLALTQLGSATGYLLPQALLLQEGVEPGERVLVGGDAQAALAVYRGEVDAAAVAFAPLRADGSPGDARLALLADYPDVATIVEVLCLSEPVPLDPLVYRADLPLDLAARLTAGLVDLVRSAEGRQALARLYQLSGLAPVSDADYDGLRSAMATLGLDAARLLHGEYTLYARAAAR